MTGGNVTKKRVPWWRLHEISKELNGELKELYIQDSNGKKYKRIVIEYEDNE